MRRGYQVVAVADATGSPGTGHEFGLERLRGAGVLVCTVKGLYYEWIRTVDQSPAFAEKPAEGLEYPYGIVL